MSQLIARILAQKTSFAVGGATLVCALGIGYIMQYGFALPGAARTATQAPAPLEVTAIMPTSSASAVALPAVASTLVDTSSLAAPAAEPEVQLETVAFSDDSSIDVLAPDPEPDTGFACDISMSAEPAAGAMVQVSLVAPCLGDERVTLHHQGMIFTDVLGSDGSLAVMVPALAEQALFIADFASGQGATAMTKVTSLPFYDRVAVQWRGAGGLQLHAREFAAEYFSDGHVWAEATGDLTSAARGEGGFLVRLGDSSTPEAHVAEIYSFPSGTSQRIGEILLSVEAEITANNCDQNIEAQTLEVRLQSTLRTRNLSLQMPDCEAVGDFLVLKNLVEDLTIAAR